MVNLPNIFDSNGEYGLVSSRIISKRSLKANIKKLENENLFIFKSITENEPDKGTIVEIFVDNELIAKNKNINGSNIQIKIGDRLKNALNDGSKINILKSIVEFDKSEDGEFIQTNNKLLKENYTTNSKLVIPELKNEDHLFVSDNVPKFKEKSIKFYTVFYPRTDFYQEIPPLNIIKNNPFQKLFRTEQYFKSLNRNRENIFNKFYRLNSGQLKIISDKNKFYLAREIYDRFYRNSLKLKEIYLKSLKDNSHFKSLKLASKSKFRTLKNTDVSLTKKDVLDTLEFILKEKNDFNIDRWNGCAIDRNKVKDYVSNRKSIYDINSRKRTYSIKEIIEGTDFRNESIPKTVCSETAYLKMIKEDKDLTSGIIEKFNHYICLSTFYKVIK